MKEIEIGYVEHYFGHLNVAGMYITSGKLKIGDTIHIKGHTTDFTEKIESMQVEHADVTEAKPGDHIGVRMVGKCREHDKIYVIIE